MYLLPYKEMCTPIGGGGGGVGGVKGHFGYVYKMGLDARKPCLRWFAKRKGADQPAHPRSLISAFVIRFLESIICKLATDEISIF